MFETEGSHGDIGRANSQSSSFQFHGLARLYIQAFVGAALRVRALDPAMCNWAIDLAALKLQDSGSTGLG